jgi:hypothetical protein
MLLNISNHPSSKWSFKQFDIATQKYTKVTDLPFPDIPPQWDIHTTKDLALIYFEKISAMVPVPIAVHIMGEFSFTFTLVTLLKESGIACLASTSKRIVKEENGIKLSTFEFVRFREYY